ncbi:MAG: PTS sugar transporter subunit IIA [Desulfamplus sp.]|nr:PTS sugar transporter subunit IIA [Desulfamplus sp.]
MRRSLTQIADDLGLNMDTLNRWIRQGKIPVNQQGNMGIYNQSELNRWAEKQRKILMSSDDEHVDQKTHQNQTAHQNKETLSSSLLFSAFKRGGIFHGITGKRKTEVIQAAVEKIPDFPGKNLAEIYHQLMEREKLASTGIGQGVAIPHPRNPIEQGFSQPMIVACFLENNVDFQAIDDKPVFVLFLLMSSTIENHLNMLSRLSFCLRDREFMTFVRQKPDADLFLNRIKEMESSIDKREM